MKILHIIPAYKPAYSRGGPIWSVHSLNKWLVKRGMEVTVYTTNITVEEDVPLNEPVDVDGVEVIYFPVKNRSAVAKALADKWEYSRDMKRAIKENIKDFDLVHVTSVFLSVSTLGTYYAKKAGIPRIISPRGALMKGTLKGKSRLLKKIYLSLVEKRNLRRASAIHFTTDKAKEEYEELGLPLKKSIVIPNGLEKEEFELDVEKGKFRKEYSIPEDKKVILFLSRINWKKGLDTLIPSFKKALEEYGNAILVIAGPDGGCRKKAELEIKKSKLKINEDVIFTGMLLGEDKISAYQDSDIFALPSYSENFGIVVAEAMYFGLPVVTTPQVGISDIVEKSHSGLVVEKNIQAVSEAILKILKDEHLYQEMSKNGKRASERNFSMDSVVDKWIEVYNDIINLTE